MSCMGSFTLSMVPALLDRFDGCSEMESYCAKKCQGAWQVYHVYAALHDLQEIIVLSGFKLA